MRCRPAIRSAKDDIKQAERTVRERGVGHAYLKYAKRHLEVLRQLCRVQRKKRKLGRRPGRKLMRSAAARRAAWRRSH
jgi:hypothetical protein